MRRTDRGRVVVVGSLNIDLTMRVRAFPLPGETVAALDGVRAPGGKGANQAVAAARLTAAVIMIGMVGQDSGGDDSLRALLDDGVDVGQVGRSSLHPTGEAVILLDADRENEIVVHPGANADLDAIQVRGALAHLGLQRTDVVLLGLETPDAAAEAAASAAREAGATVVLNPSPVRTLHHSLLDDVDLLVVNETEAVALGADAAPEVAARRLAQTWSVLVLLTRGAKGALLVRSADEQEFLPPATTLVDPSGAGDTLLGVLAAGLADGRRLQDAVDLAVTAASYAVSIPGIRAGMPTLAQALAAR